MTRRPDALARRRRAVVADGALDVGGQLAAAQPGQGAGRDAAQLVPAPGARGRRRAVLPVARVAGGRREVPLRARAARRHATPRCGARWSSWARTCRPSPRSPARGSSNRRSRCCSTGRRGGRPSSTRIRRSTSIRWPSCGGWYDALWARNVAADIVGPADELVAVPGGDRARCSTCSTTRPRRALATFAEAGGTVRGDLLQRHRRRARPHPARRLPGRAARPARRAHRGVLPARARGFGRAHRIRRRAGSGANSAGRDGADGGRGVRRRAGAPGRRRSPRESRSGRVAWYVGTAARRTWRRSARPGARRGGGRAGRRRAAAAGSRPCAASASTRSYLFVINHTPSRCGVGTSVTGVTDVLDRWAAVSSGVRPGWRQTSCVESVEASALGAAQGQAGDELPLQHEVHDQGRDGDDQRAGGEQVVVLRVLPLQVVDRGRDRVLRTRSISAPAPRRSRCRSRSSTAWPSRRARGGTAAG